MQIVNRHSAHGRRRAVLRSRFEFVAVLLLCLGFSAVAQQQISSDKQETKWETLEGCRLLPNAVVDGDSFHVLHNEREYIFRLYFVDAPESDASLKERIKDQSAYFGLPTDAIPRAGKAAAAFTRSKLAGTNFTIVTRWQNAMGRSSLARFYAIVLIGDENLAEQLVANGLARIYGLRANWPDGPRSTTFINKLKNLELTAREKRLGIWDETLFAREAVTNGVVTTETSTTVTPSEPLDLNTATVEQLDKLPGIGPVLATRIVAGRPYRSVEDLDKVSGIGKATIEKLRPFVRVSETSP